MTFLLGLLRLLEFMEFMTAPLGLVVSLWLMVYSCLVRVPLAGIVWAIPVLCVVLTEAYLSFKEPE